MADAGGYVSCVYVWSRRARDQRILTTDSSSPEVSR